MDDWNEQELEVMFIGPLLVLVDYQSPYYSLFFNRRLQAKIDEIEVGGVVDFMLASGKQHPRQPFFCLHEYKRSHGRDNDPLGQLLIAMLSAQTKNDKPHQPFYGLYVEGRFWYFVILKDKTYAVSEPYTATQDDLFIIFKALRKLKGLIEPFIQT